MKTMLLCRNRCIPMSTNVPLAGICLLILLAITGCGKRTPNASLPAPSPEQIKQLVADLNVKNPDTGMGFDLRVAAASRLGEIGPAAKEYGAVPAVETVDEQRSQGQGRGETSSRQNQWPLKATIKRMSTVRGQQRIRILEGD